MEPQKNPAIVVSVSISLLTFATILANFLIQTLSWIMYYLNTAAWHVFSSCFPVAIVVVVLCYIGALPIGIIKNPAIVVLVSVLLLTFSTILANFLIQTLSWIMYYLNITAWHVFNLFYPAALVAVIVAWCISVLPIDMDRFEIPQNYRNIALLMRLVLCIIVGQFTLLSLPPVVNFFAMLFATAPNILFTIVFSMGVVGYSLYLVLLQTIRCGREPRKMNDFAKEGSDVGDNACIVCMVNPKTHLIKPCNHFCACLDCIRQLNECPLCKRPINMSERIYST